MNANKFKEQKVTADGSERASVDLLKLKTLWFNTGTLCNLSCKNCYIESSPTNDRLAFISANEVQNYLNEIAENEYPVELIGLTGGEPFLNLEIMDILSRILKAGHEVLVLTNALRVINRHKAELERLKDIYGKKLHLRISLDHYTQEIHEKERGAKSFTGSLENLKWLWENGFNISLAGRSLIKEDQKTALLGYQKLLQEHQIELDLKLGSNIVIFPEMGLAREVPEITTQCWGILKKTPEQQMCSSERMIVKRKGYDTPVVVACTLIAYDEKFELGKTLKDSEKRVYLNHAFCAQFCVLGGASCSSAK